MKPEEYKSKLLEKKENLLARLVKLNKVRTRVEGPLEANIADQSISLQNDEVEDFLSELERDQLKLINNALLRIEEGTYTKCINCDNIISEKRLQALPYTNLCIDCMEELRFH